MKSLIVICLTLLPFFSFSQSVVSYHQSPNGGQVAYAYEINNRFRPELRLYANTFMEDLFLKMNFTYDWIEKENYEFYSGLSLNVSPTLGIPIGLNLYPFTNKNFGFMIELAPSIPLDQNGGAFFAGSWGIRYIFNKEGKDD